MSGNQLEKQYSIPALIHNMVAWNIFVDLTFESDYKAFVLYLLAPQLCAIDF